MVWLITITDFHASRSSHADVSPADYDASRPIQGSMYLHYDDTSFVGDQVQPLPVFDRNADQMSYPAGSFYQPNPAYGAIQPHIAVCNSQKAPEVTSYSPQQGSQGTRILIEIQSMYDLGPQSPLNLTLMFGGQAVQSELTVLQHRDSIYQYALATHAPAFLPTIWTSTYVPLQVQVHNGSTYVNDIDIGPFRYIDGLDQGQMSPQESSRKRKISGDPTELTRMPAKRSSKQQLQSGRTESYDLSPYAQSDSYSYSQATQTSSSSSPYDSLMAYGRSPSQRNFEENDPSRRGLQSYYPVSRPQSLSKAMSPQMWNSAYASTNERGRNSMLTTTPASRLP